MFAPFLVSTPKNGRIGWVLRSVIEYIAVDKKNKHYFTHILQNINFYS